MTPHLKRGLGALVGTLAAAAVVVSSAAAAAPKNLTPPTITGTERQGRVLTASNGTWEGSPTTFAYQWQRCNTEGTGCANITGATSKTYTLVAADVDHKIRVGVVASNPDGGTTAYSAPTNVISANTAPRNTVRPTITGRAQVAEELTASTGTWTGGVRTYAFQWERCDAAGAACVDVTGATGRTYGVRALDVGSTLRVQVTATNLAGSASATSDRTAVVVTATSPPPPPPPPPTATNKKPRLTMLSARYIGSKIYIRVRVCDEPGTIRIYERDSKPGAGLVTRRLASGRITASCAVFARNWLPAARFRTGRIYVAVWVRDAKNAQSNIARFSLKR